MSADFPTADLCDAHGDELQVAEPVFRDFGGWPRFHGQIRVVRAPEDNTQVRAALEEPGNGAVLVVDGGGSRACALLGDKLGELAVANGWSGVVVNGCVRDSAALAALQLGVKALAATPKKSEKRGRGERDVEVVFAGARFVPGHWLYADTDGIVLSPQELPPPE